MCPPLSSHSLIYCMIRISLSLLWFIFFSPPIIYSLCCTINYISVVCGGSSVILVFSLLCFVLFFSPVRCLDVSSTHKPTTWHSDPHDTSTKHSIHCDNLLLWHFDPLTFYYCDGWTQWNFTTATLGPLFGRVQVTNIRPPLKSWTFCHCNRTSTYFYLDCDRMSTFALKRNVDVLSHVIEEHLEAFRIVLLGGGQNITMVKIIMQKIVKSCCTF